MHHRFTYVLSIIISTITSFSFASFNGFSSSNKILPRNHQNLLNSLRLTYQSLLTDSGTRHSKKHCELVQSSLVQSAQGSGPQDPTSTSASRPTLPVAHSTATSSVSRKPSASSTTSSSTSSPTPSSQWKLAESHQGSNFFDGWNFFQGSDPTGGVVTYVDKGSAQSKSLISVNNAGNAVIAVEKTPTVQNTRMAVRIETQSVWNGALIVLDAVHIPTGCGTWPAFWTTNGPLWPSGGEIDIVESVHDYTNNQATLHTDPGCSIDPSSSFSGSVVGSRNCWSTGADNTACGIRAAEVSVGVPFNQNNGGVYILKWDETGIAVYYFPRGQIPDDVQLGSLQPSTWGVPLARWGASTCDPSKLFFNHTIIFDTTLCGQLASGTWSVGGAPGQDQSCAQRTGFSACEDFVRANGPSFQQAYWEITSVKMYRKAA